MKGGLGGTRGRRKGGSGRKVGHAATGVLGGRVAEEGGKPCSRAFSAPDIASSTLPRFTFPPCTLSPFLVQNAFKCYVRSRDYCTTSKHILSMCLSAIRAAVEMNNWMHVQNYVAKAEQTPDAMVSVGGAGKRGFGESRARWGRQGAGSRAIHVAMAHQWQS